MQSPISARMQQVQDEQGNSTLLFLGSGNVGVGTASPDFIFTVQGDPGPQNCLAQINSASLEASLEFRNATDNLAWRIGSGGGAGQKALFVWNPENGILLTINGTTLTFNGTIAAQAITVGRGGPNLPNIPPASQAPSTANLEAVFVDTNTGNLYYQ
ncbi:MAG TPA: hypothetical protein VF746_20025 [Longimicrobium sp.]